MAFRAAASPAEDGAGWLAVLAAALTALAAAAALLLILRSIGRCFRTCRLGNKPLVVGFFHPYCNSAGGGERVLWKAVEELLARSAAHIIIYTGDVDATRAQILSKAADRFHIPALVRASVGRVDMVYLRHRWAVEASRYPRFTLLGQALGSMLLGLEALLRCPPHVFIDTTGYAFTYPLAALFGCRVAAYAHYPTISTDMLARVFERRPSYNNDEAVASSRVASCVKSVYYRLFALLYGLVGRFADLAMVNSSWTYAHIASLWGRSDRVRVVFPPCDTTSLRSIPLEDPRQPVILSIAQFRPEKDHARQVDAFFRLVFGVRGAEAAAAAAAVAAAAAAAGPWARKRVAVYPNARLALVGGVRDEGDKQRLEALRQMVARLGLEEQVEFRTNVPFSELKDWLARSLAGIHTMWNEHFGIGVVEYMAAGVVTVANNSGGPRADIVVPVDGQPTGFLASSEDEYADALKQIFDAYARGDKMDALRRRAREHASQFSDERFMASFGAAMRPLLDAAAARRAE